MKVTDEQLERVKSYFAQILASIEQEDIDTGRQILLEADYYLQFLRKLQAMENFEL